MTHFRISSSEIWFFCLVLILNIMPGASSARHGTNDDFGDTAVTVEAESGRIGSDFAVRKNGDITYVTTLSNYTGQTSPEDTNRVITYRVTFQDSGNYNLFVRLRVGSGSYDDDSFFYARGFGEKNVAAGSDWVFINGLAGAGFSSPSEVVDETGTAGSEVWKWVNVSKNLYSGASPEGAFSVETGDLTQTFYIASREDGLWIDKMAFGKSHLYFTVDALDNGLPGSVTKPEPDSSLFYQGPPLAEGASKLLGNVRGLRDDNFANYWNQLTPGNEGKWGSVATTSDTLHWNWSGLDNLYNYAQEHDLFFRDHTLIWGNQQPVWIENLDSTLQIQYIRAWFRMMGERYPLMDMVDVVNEPLHDPPRGATNGNYIQALGGNGETGWDWVINAFQLARQFLPNTQLLLNEYGIINDNTATTNYLKIIDLLKERGLIDAIGVQGHRFELEYANVNTLKNNLDRLAATGLPVYITEMDLGNLKNEGTPDDDQQLQLYQKIFPVLWEHPSVKGITLWGYLEGQMWQTTCHLVLSDGSWRPALDWLARYIQDNPMGVLHSTDAIPEDFRLEQNYPNPFNPATHIRFSVMKSENISLKIYDILGREVIALIDESLMPGVYHVTWDARNTRGIPVESGTYFYRLSADGRIMTQKMLLLK
ncbi:endo-1,4-beta-xylanase [bacterium]|nr:endo-1,4-beta-xylanase [bacterium]